MDRELVVKSRRTRRNLSGHYDQNIGCQCTWYSDRLLSRSFSSNAIYSPSWVVCMIEELSKYIETAVFAFVFFGSIMWFSCYMTSYFIYITAWLVSIKENGFHWRLEAILLIIFCSCRMLIAEYSAASTPWSWLCILMRACLISSASNFCVWSSKISYPLIKDYRLGQT